MVNEYYNLNTFVNQANAFTKNLDIDQQTKAIYNKNLDQYLVGQYDLGIKYLSEQKFREAEDVFKDISRFNPNYKDTQKQLSIAVNEPVYLSGIQLFGEKKYMSAYEKWNESIFSFRSIWKLKSSCFLATGVCKKATGCCYQITDVNQNLINFLSKEIKRMNLKKFIHTFEAYRQ